MYFVIVFKCFCMLCMYSKIVVYELFKLILNNVFVFNYVVICNMYVLLYRIKGNND